MSDRNDYVDRRTVLKGIGAGAAALTLGVGGSRRAQGQATRPPKRVIFFYGGSGALPDLWQPRGGDTDWALNDLHAPLAAHRDRLSFVGNLHMLSSESDPTPPSNAHVAGGTHAMTAAHRVTADRAGARSIDQAIASALVARGDVTRLPSLEVQAADWPHAEGLPVYSGPGDQLPFLWNPAEVYDRLFPDGPVDPGTLDRRPEQRSRVLEFARQRFGRLEGARLGPDARGRLGAHAAEVESLRARMAAAGGGRELNVPDRSLVASLPDFEWESSRETKATYWQTTARVNTELVVAALHADVTRVVTYYVHDAPGPLCPYDGSYYRPGDFGSLDIHDLTHKVNDDGAPLAGEPRAREVIRQQHLRTYEVLGQLLDQLAEAVEPDGSRLIDHTLVVFCSQIANGSHTLEGLPWFTAGDCQGAIRTGRWLQSGERRGHGDLFQTVARALEVDVGSFGSEASREIPGLLA